LITKSVILIILIIVVEFDSCEKAGNCETDADVDVDVDADVDADTDGVIDTCYDQSDNCVPLLIYFYLFYKMDSKRYKPMLDYLIK
jgi:hypothetical protein